MMPSKIMDAEDIILSTIAFYDAVGELPLTSLELYRGLLRQNDNSPKLSFCDFLKIIETQKSIKHSPINNLRGFYFLKKNKDAYAKRINLGKTGIKKWRIAQRMANVIFFLPFVRMVAITGSLALNNTRRESDIDVLIVTKRGYIWTTRMLVSVIMQILGKRRHGIKISDRICLNHYISEDNLALRPQSLFSAHICASLIPLWDKDFTNNKLMSRNKHIIDSASSHAQSFPPLFHLKTLRPTPTFGHLLAKINEIIIECTIGRPLESIMKNLQARRIKRSIENMHIESKEVIFDDHALVFHHPRPVNQEALYLYKKNLEELNLPNAHFA
jgi:hypothetical protein